MEPGDTWLEYDVVISGGGVVIYGVYSDSIGDLIRKLKRISEKIGSLKASVIETDKIMHAYIATPHIGVVIENGSLHEVILLGTPTMRDMSKMVSVILQEFGIPPERTFDYESVISTVSGRDFQKVVITESLLTVIRGRVAITVDRTLDVEKALDRAVDILRYISEPALAVVSGKYVVVTTPERVMKFVLDLDDVKKNGIPIELIEPVFKEGIKNIFHGGHDENKDRQQWSHSTNRRSQYC